MTTITKDCFGASPDGQEVILCCWSLSYRMFKVTIITGVSVHPDQRQGGAECHLLGSNHHCPQVSSSLSVPSVRLSTLFISIIIIEECFTSSTYSYLQSGWRGHSAWLWWHGRVGKIILDIKGAIDSIFMVKSKAIVMVKSVGHDKTWHNLTGHGLMLNWRHTHWRYTSAEGHGKNPYFGAVVGRLIFELMSTIWKKGIIFGDPGWRTVLLMGSSNLMEKNISWHR